MEEELLEEMIRDRENQIKKIEKKIEDQEKKMERLVQQKKDIEHSAKTEMVERRETLERARQRFEKLVQQYQQSKDSLDMKKQQQQQQSQGNTAVAPGLHLYNEIMKAVSSPESTDSSYVIRMQAQLCKAMHSMGMMETQLQLTKAHTETYQKSVKDTVTTMVEEKSQIELKLMNDLVLADNDRREVETKRNEISAAFTTEKDELMEKIERQHQKEQGDDENGEGGVGNGDDDEGGDEEEMEELREILSQGREEIERLEHENKKEAERLEELKIKAAEVRGQDVVDDIVRGIAEEFKEREEDEEDEDDW